MKNPHSHHLVLFFSAMLTQCAVMDIADDSGALIPEDEDSDDPPEDDDDDAADDDDDSSGDDDDSDDSGDDDDSDSDSADTDSPCDGVICDAPPANDCENGDHLRQYESEGECVVEGAEGVCVYDHQSIFCEFGCDDSVVPAICTDDPCAGIECVDPPADFCEDADSLMLHDEIGECIEGICDYHPQPFACEHGCWIGNAVCYDCTGDDDCAAYGEWCDSGECAPCTTDTHCGPHCENCLPDRFCNSAKTACVECEDNDDCDPGEVCNGDSECEPGCGAGGQMVGGYCWYKSLLEGSCSETCAAHGGYHTATRTFAGSDGTDAHCESVLDALNMGSGSPAWADTYKGMGCSYRLGVRHRDIYPTTAGGWDYDVYRACACNN